MHNYEEGIQKLLSLDESFKKVFTTEQKEIEKFFNYYFYKFSTGSAKTGYVSSYINFYINNFETVANLTGFVFSNRLQDLISRFRKIESNNMKHIPHFEVFSIFLIFYHFGQQFSIILSGNEFDKKDVDAFTQIFY